MLRLLRLSLLLSLAACSSTPSRIYTPEEIAKLSMVYGYIDMSDAPSNLSQVTMKRLRPIEDAPYFPFGVKDGLFLRINMPHGVYQATSIGGHRGSTIYTYNMEQQGKGDLDQEVTKPGLYFAGAWKFKPHNKGLFKQDEFELLPLPSTSEREVLERIYARSGDLMHVAHEGPWRKRIEQRLAELKKRK